MTRNTRNLPALILLYFFQIFMFTAACPKGARSQALEVKYNLADALAGGDGTFPGTGAAGTTVVTGFGTTGYAQGKRTVDGAFVPGRTGPTRVTSTDLRFDFSSRVGSVLQSGAAVKGPGSYTDPSRLATSAGQNPDYSGDPGHHGFIAMHASQGVTFDLERVREAFHEAVAFTRFTARAGMATGAAGNFWVLVDGVERNYGVLPSASPPKAEDVSIDLAPGDRFLTLVIGDGNKGSINNSHGYFGDPQLHGSGTPTLAQAANPSPADQTASLLPWQGLGWSFGLGVTGYDVYLWKAAGAAPAAPTASVATHAYQPPRYLEYGTAYRWKVVSHLQDGSFKSSFTWAFSTAAQGAFPAPAFDISPAAQEDRRKAYELGALRKLTAAGTPVQSGLRIAFYGDSNTDVIQWQKELADSLARRGAVSLNRGINGADAAGLREGIRKYAATGGLPVPKPFPRQVAEDRPGIAVIYIGINDVLNNSPATPKAVYQGHLEAMADSALAQGAKVVLVTPAMHNEKPDGSNRFDRELDEYAEVCRAVAASRGGTLVASRQLFLAYLRNHNFALQEDGAVSFPRAFGVVNYDVVHHNGTGKHLLSDWVADGIMRALGWTPTRLFPGPAAGPSAGEEAGKSALPGPGAGLRVHPGARNPTHRLDGRAR